MKNCIYTFDIFDTCLSRLCGDPRNLFVLMAYEVIGPSCTETQANDFRYVRVSGEKEASRKYASNTTIYNIYDECDFSAYTSLTRDTLISIEMELEKKQLQPIKETLDKIDNIHSKGDRVIYISDMYLPSEFLKDVLFVKGFWKEGDSLYVSCEHGCTKSDGRLFDYVRVAEGLRKYNWIHHGDNYHSDVIVPRFKLIRSKHIQNDYSVLEKYYRTLNINPTNHAALIFTGVLRAARLSALQDHRNVFATDLIAAIYVPFVYNILHDASIKGIKRLYFLARDGYIFMKIAEVFSDIFPQIEIHYLYVSRKSLYLPSLKEVNRETLSSLLVGSSASHIKERFDNLQIELDESCYNDIASSADPIGYLLSNKETNRMINEQIANQKRTLIKYFEQEKLATQSNDVAIVDLRGTRKCQKCISSILSEHGYNEVFAYYLEGCHNRIIPDRYNDYKAFFFADNISLNPVYKGLDAVKFVLEHYFSLTSYQRTSGYREHNGNVEPVFDNEEIEDTNESIMQVNIKSCVRVAEMLKSVGILQYSKDLLNIGLSGLASFMRNPNDDLLKALIEIKSTQTKHNSRYLVAHITPSNVINHRIAWYEGSIKLTFGSVGLRLYYFILPVVKKIYRWIQ